MRTCGGPKQLLGLLASLPSTSGQCTGAVTSTLGGNPSVSRASVRTCVRDDGTAAVLTSNQLAVESEGILVERGATNLSTGSELIGSVPWGTYTSGPSQTITAGATAPTGATSAKQVAMPSSASADNFGINRSDITFTAATYAFTLFAKGASAGGTFYQSIYDNAWRSTPCVYTTSYSRCVYSVQPVAGTVFYQFGVDTRDSAQLAQPAQTVLLWGSQIELGYPHAYVPTSSNATASSADDVVTLENPLSGKDAKFCVGASFKPTSGRTWPSRSGNIALLQLGVSGQSGTLVLHRDTNGKTVATMKDADGATLTYTGGTTWTGTGGHRVAFCYSKAGGNLYLDGAEEAVSVSGAGTGALGALPASLYLGYRGAAGAGSAETLDGHVWNVCMDQRAGKCL